MISNDIILKSFTIFADKSAQDAKLEHSNTYRFGNFATIQLQSPNQIMPQQIWNKEPHIKIAKFYFSLNATILAPIPQNGQTYSNNSSAKADELFECV